MPIMEMQHDIDPKTKIWNELGNIQDIQIFHNQVLVAVYIRPDMTKGGIALPQQYIKEDRNQSKIGLILKMGPDAFVDPSQKWFNGVNLKINDWVIFRPSDGWAITLPGGKEGVLCRCIEDIDVRGSVGSPDQVW